MRIGFVGLGFMRRGMAGDLQTAGHGRLVNELSRLAAVPFLEIGAIWVDSPREVAQPRVV